jgi:hypothetical protein
MAIIFNTIHRLAQGERIWKEEKREMKAFSSRRYRNISSQGDPF